MQARQIQKPRAKKVVLRKGDKDNLALLGVFSLATMNSRFPPDTLNCTGIGTTHAGIVFKKNYGSNEGREAERSDTIQTLRIGHYPRCFK